MKVLGVGICIVGTVLAILFVPTEFLGTSLGWHFILGEVDLGFGITEKAYRLINTTTLVLELILIYGIGLALFFFGSRRRAR